MKDIIEEYESDIRYGCLFAGGRFTEAQQRTFLKENLSSQTHMAGWALGCPVVGDVIKRMGLQDALERYLHILDVGKQIFDKVEGLNYSLFGYLTTDLNRKNHGPLGWHEATSVPATYINTIPYRCGPGGYILPRLLIEDAAGTTNQTQERLGKRLKSLEQPIKDIGSPLELIAVVAERVVVDNPAITDKILKRTLSEGYLREHNIWMLFKLLLNQLDTNAPTLYERYSRLSSKEKIKMEIAVID